MEAAAIASAAVACLMVIAIVGWVIALNTKKRNGVLENENDVLRKQLAARQEQDRAFDLARGRDLAGDDDFLQDPGVQLEGVRDEG